MKKCIKIFLKVSLPILCCQKGTGLPIHIALGMAFFFMLLLHCKVSLPKHLLSHKTKPVVKLKKCLIIDAGMALSAAVLTFTGVIMAAYVSTRVTYFIHFFSTVLLLGLISVHLVQHHSKSFLIR